MGDAIFVLGSCLVEKAIAFAMRNVAGIFTMAVINVRAMANGYSRLSYANSCVAFNSNELGTMGI